MSEAAEKYVVLNNPGSYIGPYRNATAPYMAEPMDELQSRVFTGLVFVGPAQSAKALDITTPIATPDGWTTMGALRLGDTVFGDDGKPCRVVVVSPVRREHRCFRLVFDDGTAIVADAGHEWTVRDDYAENWKTLDTKTMAKKFTYRGGRSRFSVTNARALDTAAADLPIDPYVLGCWLGDGHANTSRLTLNRDDTDEITDRICAAGVNLETEEVAGANSTTVRLDPSHYREGPSPLRTWLRDFGLLDEGHDKPTNGTKHIPQAYLRASVVQRFELLRGLMDTDGHCSSGVCGFDSSNPGLADDVKELLVSLGFKVRHSTDPAPKYRYLGEVRIGKPSHKLTFVAYAEDTLPFGLARKNQKLPRRADGRPTYTGRRRIVDITEVASVPVRCVGVDNASHLFLAGRQMVPTHNTQALILNWIAYSVVIDGMDMMVYSPTQSAARDFSIRRVDRMHRAAPALGGMLQKSRDADNVHDKHYRNGMFLNLSWPTVTEFAGRPVGRIALTDYDRMPDDIGGDGSPFDLGSKRTTTFRSFAMTMAESSPSRPVENPKWISNSPHEAPPCKGILSLYNRGDRRRWLWPCPECGSYFEGKWEQLEWETKSSVLASAETAKLVCPACGYKIRQDQRTGMQEWGVWLRDGQSIDSNGKIVGTPVRSTIASFWLNGIAAAFTTWTNLVVSYLNANNEYEKTGSEDSLAKFFNTDLGLPYLPRKVESDLLPEVLKARAESMTLEDMPDDERIDRTPMVQPMVPAGVRFLVATVDVQNNVFVVQIHGIAPGTPFDVVVVDRFQIRKSERFDAQGDALWVKPSSYLEDWDRITVEVMERTYPLADGSGRRMAIRMTGCDSGGREGVTTNAYNFVRRLREAGKQGRFQLLKGDPLASRPRAQITYPDSNRRDKLSAARGDVPVMLLNSNLLKDSLRGRLESQEPGKGMIRFGNWLPDAWFSEMCVEVRTDKGWVNTRNLRNESWDLLYYCLGLCVSVLLRVEGIDWTNPPGWAGEWDVNDLVSKADDRPRFTPKPKSLPSFAKFAEAMG